MTSPESDFERLLEERNEERLRQEQAAWSSVLNVDRAKIAKETEEWHRRRLAAEAVAQEQAAEAAITKARVTVLVPQIAIIVRSQALQVAPYLKENKAEASLTKPASKGLYSVSERLQMLIGKRQRCRDYDPAWLVRTYPPDIKTEERYSNMWQAGEGIAPSVYTTREDAGLAINRDGKLFGYRFSSSDHQGSSNFHISNVWLARDADLCSTSAAVEHPDLETHPEVLHWQSVFLGLVN